MTEARAVSNRFLACDWCGLTPDKLYLPATRAGVFCRDCVGDVLNPPPPKPVTLAKDGMPADNDIGRALDAYLESRPKDPVFCGRGRSRKKAVEPPKPVDQSRWRYFSRTDRARVTGTKAFKGVRSIVWGVLRKSDGETIGEVLTQCIEAGLAEPQVVSVLRKMVVVYGVLGIDRQRVAG
jgi:hypothetical protein